MAKQVQPAVIIGTLVVTHRNAPVEYTGQLVDQNENYLVMDVARPRKAPLRHVIPMTDVIEAHLTEDGTSYVYARGELVNEYADVSMVEIVDGAFSGTYEGKDGTYAVLAPAGTYVFLPVAAEGEQPKGKAKAEEKPATGGKATGKSAKAPETEEEEEEFEPEEGSYVLVTDADGDEYEGTVTSLTAKKIIIEDADGEVHTFLLAKVTVAEAEASEEEEEEEEEKPKGKAAGKSTGKATGKATGKSAKADESEEEDEEEEEEEKPKGKAAGKATGKSAKAAPADDDWDE